MAKKNLPKIKVEDENTPNLTGYELEYIPLPTYLYNSGDRVIYGGYDEAYVLNSFYSDRIYTIKAIHYENQTQFHNHKYEEVIKTVSWLDIRKFHKNNESFVNNERYELNYSQRSMRDICGKVFHFGTDMNPEYQRELVWELEDKISLLDSIFNGLDIGKFVFVRKPYKSNDTTYEILDGKQRVNTIIEFYMDKIKYRGKTFSELSRRDQVFFDDYTISMAEIIKPEDTKRLLKYFIRLNTTGHVIDKKHIEKIKNMIEN